MSRSSAATDIQLRITQILETRRKRLPEVEAEVARLNALDEELGQLQVLVDDLRGYNRTPAEVKSALSTFRTDSARSDVAEALAALRVLNERFSRATINIGVSGRARVGKSTLLQKLSGLTDAQIPTGTGIPVTAVRSRIFHSPTASHATIELHDFKSFRNEVLQPFHDELKLEAAPHTIDAFRQFDYSDKAGGELDREPHSATTLLRRLREMQQALPSYEPLLRGGQQRVDLADLRPYVAYPTNEQANDPHTQRRYLAVRGVRIECPFPRVQVEQVAIVDLPGLGELAPQLQRHHVSGLKHEVDLVLLIKRPMEGMAYWANEDAHTMDLLDQARDHIASRRDFVMAVLNVGGTSPELLDKLRDDVRRNANDGEDGKHFRVLEGDATNPDDVSDRILTPALEHLAERLGEMDRQVFDGTKASYAGLSDTVEALLRQVEDALSIVKVTATRRPLHP